MGHFDTVSLWILMVQVVVLAVFPLWIYRVMRQPQVTNGPLKATGQPADEVAEVGEVRVFSAGPDGETASRSGVQPPGVRRKIWSAPRPALVGLVILAGLFLCGGLGLPALGLALSPHTGEQLYDRLIWPTLSPVFLLLVLALVVGIPRLAMRGVLPIGFSLFLCACAFAAYWFGLGGLSPNLLAQWETVAFIGVLGALLGDLLAQLPLSHSLSASLAFSSSSLVSPHAVRVARWRTLVLWTLGGALMSLTGVLLGGAVGSVVAHNSWRTPYQGDMAAVSLVVVTALLVGLGLGTLTAVLTGLITGKARGVLLPVVALLPIWWVGLSQLAPKSIVGPDSLRPYRVLEAEGGSVDSLTFSPDGQLLAAGLGPDVVRQQEPGKLRVWRTSDWSEVKSLTLDAGTPDIAFSPDGALLAVGSNSGSIQLYRTSDWTQVKRLSVSGRRVGVAFSPDGKILAAGAETSIGLWSTNDWSALRTLQVAEMYSGSTLAFSPDGRSIATGSSDWKVRLYNVSNGALLQTLSGHSQEVTGLSFSANGQVLAATSWDNTVLAWRLSDGTLLHTWELAATSVAASPDGRLVAGGATWSLPLVWRVSDGAALHTLLNEPESNGVESKTFSLAFSPDGKVLAGGSLYQRVRLWKLP